MRAADALDATSQAARGGLQGLDLEKESDTFYEEAAVTLDSIPAMRKDVKLFDNNKTQYLRLRLYDSDFKSLDCSLIVL